MSTTARLDGDHYVINGVKSWITSGPIGKATIVFATVDKDLKHKGNKYEILTQAMKVYDS